VAVEPLQKDGRTDRQIYRHDGANSHFSKFCERPKQKNGIIIYFTSAPVHSSCVTKAQRNQGSQRILLGDNTGDWEVMLWPIRVRCVGVRILAGLVRYIQLNGFRGLGVCMLASGTQDRGFAPDRSLRIFPVGKIHSMPSFGGNVKQSVPCPSFGA
jgi:hypothetical protein